jgi:hypothetical protein
MAARQRQCPRLTFLRSGEQELLCSCSLPEMENGEPIWRPYPVAVSSLVLFFEWLTIDGRMAYNGIDVSFQLIHPLSQVLPVEPSIDVRIILRD